MLLNLGICHSSKYKNMDILSTFYRIALIFPSKLIVSKISQIPQLIEPPCTHKIFHSTIPLLRLRLRTLCELYFPRSRPNQIDHLSIWSKLTNGAREFPASLIHRSNLALILVGWRALVVLSLSIYHLSVQGLPNSILVLCGALSPVCSLLSFT